MINDGLGLNYWVNLIIYEQSLASQNMQSNKIRGTLVNDSDINDFMKLGKKITKIRYLKY